MTKSLSGALGQDALLVSLDRVDPGIADGHLAREAVVVPHRSERKCLELFEQSESPCQQCMEMEMRERRSIARSASTPSSA